MASVPARTTEPDVTVQAFAQWLTELKGRNSRTQQEMLAEMSVIRDGITSNNMELIDFKRNSTGISQQMQSQLTDLREKLTNAFGEITSLVRQKTVSDQEMMLDINNLQDNLSCKTSELETLKRSYSQAHAQLQSSLIQIQNHLQVTTGEVQTAKAACDKAQRDITDRFTDIDDSLHVLEDELSVGNAENRNQMLQLQEEIGRIHDSLASVNAEFVDHKKTTASMHNKLQSQLWGLEEGRRGGQGVEPVASYQPESLLAEPQASSAYGMMRPAGMGNAASQPTLPQAPAVHRPGSTTLAQPIQMGPHAAATSALVVPAPMPARSNVLVAPVYRAG